MKINKMIKILYLYTLVFSLNNHCAQRDFFAEFEQYIDNNNIEGIKRLISEKININIENKEGRTPLHLACRKKDIKLDIISLLIENGADTNLKEKSYSNNSPLHLTSRFSTHEACSILLKNGANVNAINSDGYSPLCKAIERNNNNSEKDCALNICKILISYGAKINSVKLKHTNPLDLAILKKQNDISNLLIISGANIHKVNFWQQTPLHLAAKGKMLGVCSQLILLGADLNAIDSLKRTPLLLIAGSDAREINWESLLVLKILLNNGANINAKNNEGKTALQKILYQSSPILYQSSFNEEFKIIKYEIVKYLIEKGIDINSVDCHGNTALHYSLFNIKDFKIIELLIKNGANIDIANYHGNTPLHCAAMSGKIDICQLLLKYLNNNKKISKH